MKPTCLLVVLSAALGGCASVRDYTPTVAPSTSMQSTGVVVEGTPVPDEAALTTQQQLDTLKYVRAAHSFSIIYGTPNTPRLEVNGVPLPRPPSEGGYLVYDIPRDVCRESIDYRVGGETAFDSAYEGGTLSVRPGIYVEHGSMVDLVLPGGNNAKPLIIELSDVHLIRHQLHNMPNVAKLAVRSVDYNSNIDVQVKKPSETQWRTLGPFTVTGWIEFELECGQYFEIRVIRQPQVSPGATVAAKISIAQVSNTGTYLSASDLIVWSVGNPP